MPVSYTIFNDKVILKWNKELLELHKRVLTTYLISRGLRVRTRQKFFILYSLQIDEKNIQAYFYTPLKILVDAIVLDKLETVSIYKFKDGRKKRKRRTRKG
jgi:hypothetical protein